MHTFHFTLQSLHPNFTYTCTTIYAFHLSWQFLHPYFYWGQLAMCAFHCTLQSLLPAIAPRFNFLLDHYIRDGHSFRGWEYNIYYGWCTLYSNAGSCRLALFYYSYISAI
jgi:hypothetical protein